MRILHICQRDNPDTGGSLRVAESLVIEQRQKGLDAWLLFLYGPPGEMIQALGPNIAYLGLDTSREAGRGIFKLLGVIRKLQPDVIHSHDGITWPRLAFLMQRTPVVMHSHLPADPTMNLATRLLIRLTTDIVVGISLHTIKSWEDCGFPASRIHFVPNGVDFERFHGVPASAKKDLRERLNLPVEKTLVVWVGRLHASTKGTERIERFAALMPKNAVLVVVGNGPSYNEILEQCRTYIANGRVVMAGSTSTPEVYYKAADLFLFTSHKEAFGLVILEAAASDLPIISYPLERGGAGILLEEINAFNIKDDATDVEVGELIDRVLTDPQSRKAVRDRIKLKYSWSRQSQEVLFVYQTLLGLSIPDASNNVAPRVLVCQHGARHRYAIPRMLNRAGMLNAFYTDSSAESLIGKCVKYLGGWAPKAWRSFARWHIDDVPRSKIHSSDSTYFVEKFQRLYQTPKTGLQLFYQRHRILSAKMKRWGLQGANILYSMYHEDLAFVRWAKDRGVLSVVDVFISPVTDEIMQKEQEIYPDWIDDNDDSAVLFERELWLKTASVADVLLCPSEWVAEGVRTVSPEHADKIAIVPYGCSIDYQGKVNEPVKGRILFAGRDSLRKGLHYLAQAATRLKNRLPELDVRIAGNMPENVFQHPVCKDLNFLGSLDSGRMKQEFLSADALVLPALSEGFAGVVAEAIGAGCPVIVTPESGSPVIHEREGLIVPSGDIEALADAIERMVTDREFRSSCSRNCLEQVSFYSEEQWQKRLVAALTDGLKSQRGNVGS